jgi:DNA-binding MarR family transcriptional regulator
VKSQQYITDEGLVIGYLYLAREPISAEDLVNRLGKKRTTLIPKIYRLREQGKIKQTKDPANWRAKPYILTDSGRKDSEKYHLAEAVSAIFN